MLLHSLLLLLPLNAPFERPVKPIPTLTREPSLDAQLKEYVPAADIKMPAFEAGQAALQAKVAVYKDTVFLGVQVTDNVVTADDALDVTLFFPESGTTSRGFIYRFGKDGLRPRDLGPPEFAAKLVRVAVKEGPLRFEIAIPARALPRFPAAQPLMLSACFEYSDVDVPASEPLKTHSCTNEMVGGPIRLPDGLRQAAKLSVPGGLEGIEARPRGWAGYSKLHSPSWLMGDADLTSEMVADFVGFDLTVVEPGSAGIPLPATFALAGHPLVAVLSGQNPFAKEPCNHSRELRLVMYAVRGRTATRVLEWPAATCMLGRATRFELDDESGQLVIGYTNGQTAHFVWSEDHFERSELGTLFRGKGKVSS